MVSPGNLAMAQGTRKAGISDYIIDPFILEEGCVTTIIHYLASNILAPILCTDVSDRRSAEESSKSLACRFRSESTVVGASSRAELSVLPLPGNLESCTTYKIDI